MTPEDRAWVQKIARRAGSMLDASWAPRGLLGPPVTTADTGAVSADTTIGSATRGVVLGRWYRVEWTCFDANTSVAGDRFTFTPKAGSTALGNAGNGYTFAFPSTAVAATPIPPIVGWWQATSTGSVTFSVHVVRTTGTGTIDVSTGELTVSDWGQGT